MEFKDLIKKYFYTNSSSAASATARIPLLNNSGEPVGCDSLGNIELNSQTRTCGVLLATSDASDIMLIHPTKVVLSGVDSYGVFGVAICEGGRCVIVGKDETTAKWAKSNVTGGTTAKNTEQALADFDGIANTTTIYNTLGSNAPAAECCLKYYAKNFNSANGIVGVGNWHLPSAGEMWMIWSHFFEVNRLMNAIGGTPLSRDSYYWTSTEYSTTSAWFLGFLYGDFNGANKNYSSQLNVRPVLSL